MSLVARLALGLAGAAAMLPLPAALDRWGAGRAIAAVGWYQRRLSQRSGRLCLFHPSCSHRAVALLAAHGWNAGMPRVRAQLRRCGGDYTLVKLSNGQIEMITADGQRFTAAELSPAIRG